MTSSTALICLAAFEGIFFLTSLFYLPAIVKAMKFYEKQGLARPWTLWLELIPVLNLFWQFRNAQVATSAVAPASEHEREQAEATRPYMHLRAAAWARLAAFLLLIPTVYVTPAWWDQNGPYRDPRAALVGWFLVALVYPLWQRIRYARQVRHLLKGQPAGGPSLAVIESYSPPACSCSVLVGTGPERASEVCVTWAEALGWQRVKNVASPLTFCFSRDRDPQIASEAVMRVEITAEGATCKVRFVASDDVWVGGYALVPRLRRATVTFARGVCSELAQSGVTVTPHDFAIGGRNRSQLAKVAKLRRGIDGVLAIVGLGFCVLLVLGLVLAVILDYPEAYIWAPLSGLSLLYGLRLLANSIRRLVARMGGLISLFFAALLLFMTLGFAAWAIDPRPLSEVWSAGLAFTPLHLVG